MSEENTQTTLREQLEQAFDKYEPTDKVETTIAAAELDIDKSDKVRDEQGKFAKVEKIEDVKITPDKPAENVATQEDSAPQGLQRPTTWKKDYLPIWDKLASGQPLDAVEAKKLAEYSNQRENEYKSGVSSYKAEAESARTLQEAIAPFIPDLQKNNINPTDWIKNLGNAHRMLSLGNAEQKMQMFQQLAQSYGIPLNAVAQSAQGNSDPNTIALLNQIQELKSGFSEVQGWKSQQEQMEVQKVLKEFEDVAKFPHFQMVRSNMARLLQSGEAHDPKMAYEMAAKPIEDLIESRLAQVKIAKPDAVAVAAQAKAKAISPKSSTPRGQVVKSTAKDLRSQLESAYDQHASQRV